MNPILELTYCKEYGRYVWRFVEEYTAHGVTIPNGFETDLGSVPHLLWSIVGPQEIAHAAIIHDYHYVVQDVPRKVADKQLRLLVRREDGIGVIRSWLIYWAVRIGGRYR